jgi:hypothetical protein
MEKVPPEDLLPYQGGDADASMRVADVLRDQLLQDPLLAKFYVTILHPAARASEKIERRGVVIDLEKYQQLGDDLKKEIKACETKALELLPRKLRIKHRDKIEDQLAAGKSPLTPRILKDYFFTPPGLNLQPRMMTEKSDEPSTSRAHPRMFVHVPTPRPCAPCSRT